MTVLASGSKGNSTVVSSSRTRVLVDAGLSCRELMRRMAAVGENPETLDAILITHEHQDHIAGLGVLARKLGIPVYFTEQTHRAWVRMLTPRTTMTYAQWLEHVQREKLARAERTAAQQGVQMSENQTGGDVASIAAEAEPSAADAAAEKLHMEVAEARLVADPDLCEPAAKADPASLPGVEYFFAGSHFQIGDISVHAFTIPHDAADPCGFVFEAEGVRIAMATDLGYVPPNVKLALRRCDVMLLESNHDLEMLKDGPYPWSVKQRVLSRVGHLSNDAAAEFLANDYDGGAAYIVLGHLSESNNMPELARMSAERAIAERMSLLGNKLLLAQQSAPLASIRL